MEIRRIAWKETMPLRQSVLWPTKLLDHCNVEGDHDALHYGAFVDENLICVASVFLNSDKARLRKFATKTDFQNQGVGSKMLNHIIQSLEKMSVRIFWCDARESALNFYKRFGMQEYGERFYKSDVSYFKMKLAL